MKAERRHELKSNDLAWSLENLPLLLQRHANKILLVVIAVALVVILVRYRSNAEAARDDRVKSQMTSIRTGLTQLQTVGGSPDQDWIAATRTQIATEVSSAIEGILNDGDEKRENILAEATLARGDLYWYLANAPELPGATTRPAMKLPQPAGEYLNKSESAYKQVVDKFTGQASPWTAAQFGLAAIAENRHLWDAAGGHYDKILESKDAAAALKNQARMRSQMLKVIDKPMFVGPLHPTTVPSTTTSTISAPATSAATTAPTTRSGI